MPPNSEIEKLERRWKENPKGTVFAPYAEVLRKHGDYPMAKDILRSGLELHPDHIPGNIVLGRCCLDLGEEGPAEAAFVHVLDLDAENVIALKALADITERQGRLMEAAAWLSRLITVDPSNDEAREQLNRVATAREAASAAMVEPIVAPTVAEPQPEGTTEVVAVIQPLNPEVIEIPETRLRAGKAGGESGHTLDADAVVEAVLGPFDQAGPPPPPPLPQPSGSDVTERVTARPRPESPPPQGLDIIPGALDVGATADIETQPIADLAQDEPFQPPAKVIPQERLSDPFSLGMEDPSTIELRPTGHGEFQSPDDSAALLDLTLSPSSEFQQPDASQELRLSSGKGSEYQTASGAEELLEAVETDALLSPQGPVPEPPPQPTSGFAAISLLTTEELPTSSEETGRPAVPPGEAEPAGAVTVVEMLAAAGASTVALTAAEPPAPPGPAETVAAEGEVTELAESVRSQDLHLIFPDDATAPQPPKVRRISDEVGSGAEPESAEPPVGEPAPVFTETMAELYTRQGHIAEALNVYRGLATRTPNDPRLAQRIRELEAAQAAGSRRMSYVAVDTGGESVESFFRSLTDARPGGEGGAKGSATASPEAESSAAAAPTRPAKDPVSLSAIFGEETASGAPPAASEGPPSPSSLDSFSFDQFFGGGGASPPGTELRAAAPSDEDLDQFQNWLKSLKR